MQGAKNHGVIMPDANREFTLSQLAGAAFGAAGQRCMALPCAMFVGDSSLWIDSLVERSRKLKVNAGLCSFIVFISLLVIYLFLDKFSFHLPLIISSPFIYDFSPFLYDFSSPLTI